MAVFASLHWLDGEGEGGGDIRIKPRSLACNYPLLMLAIVGQTPARAPSAAAPTPDRSSH